MTIALLSIRPKYSNAILSRQKHVEFRLRPFRKDIEHIVIYSSSPVRKVVGFFQVKNVRVLNTKQAWKEFGNLGCLSKEEFFEYCKNREQVVAISIDKVVQLSKPITLDRVNKNYCPPQSFRYISRKEFRYLKSL